MKKNTKIIFTIVTIILIMIIAIIYSINDKNLSKEETNEEIKENNVNNVVNETSNNESIENFSIKFVDNTKENQKDNKIKITSYQEKDIYYVTENIELYLCQDEKCYTLKESLEDKQVDFSKILEKKEKKETAYDGGSSIFYFNDFNIVTCNTVEGNNDIYIGQKTLNDVSICRE